MIMDIKDIRRLLRKHGYEKGTFSYVKGDSYILIQDIGNAYSWIQTYVKNPDNSYSEKCLLGDRFIVKENPATIVIKGINARKPWDSETAIAA